MSKFDNFELEEPTIREIKTVNNINNNEINNNINNTINNNDNEVKVNFLTKKRKATKTFCNFYLEDNTYNCLVTLADENNLSLTETVESILAGYIEMNEVVPNMRVVSKFKSLNKKKGNKKKDEVTEDVKN